MTRFTFAIVLSLTCCLPALADEVSDKVCPLLEKIEAGLGEKADYAVQAEILMAVGGAYDMDGDKLRAIMPTLDTSTTEQCPAARSAILERANKTSLEAAMR